MALPNDWLSSGNPDMFGRKDWDYLRGRGTTATEVLNKLWSNQNQLAQINRPGQIGTGDQGETYGGLFDKIQSAAQSEAPAWNKAKGVGAWNYSLWGGQGFGAEDIEAARNRGASEYQIRQLYQRAGQKNLDRDNPAAQAIAANAPTPEWNYGAHGGWGFGMEDVDAMGGNLEQIRGARDWARQNRLNIGEGVTEHIQGLESDRRFEEQQAFNQQLLQQQQQQAAESTRIQQEMAAQAARVKGSSPTGVGEAASIKGSRLSITQSGGRRGTKRFARPTQYMNTLGMTSGGSTSTGKSPLNL